MTPRSRREDGGKGLDEPIVAGLGCFEQPPREAVREAAYGAAHAVLDERAELVGKAASGLSRLGLRAGIQVVPHRRTESATVLPLSQRR